MGIALWLACGVAGFAAARIIPFGPRDRWVAELLSSLAAALLLGVAATAADFGGWNEIDWRPAALGFLGALAAAALPRLRTS